MTRTTTPRPSRPSGTTIVNGTPPGPTGTSRPAVESPRVRLARLALDAARAVPGVADTDAGPTGLFFTAGGGERLNGVTCAVAPEGGYDVSLRLVCELVPLPVLAERVRLAVLSVGAQAGIAVQSVNVAITGVLDPDAP